MNIQNFKEFKALRESLKMSLTEQSVLRYLTDEQIEESLQLSFSNQEELLEFKLLGWLKDKAQAAGSWLVDTAKSVFSSVKDMVNTIKDIIVNFLKSCWTMIKTTTMSELNKNKEVVLHKVEGHLSSHPTDKVKLRKEVSSFGETLGFLTKYLTGGISKDAETNLAKIADEEVSADDAKDNPSEFDQVEKSIEKALKESLDEISIEILLEAIKENPEEFAKSLNNLNESAVGGHVPFLSAIGHKLAHYPPFSWLHNIKDWATKNANSFAEKLSNLSVKLGGPGPFDFIILGAVIGLITEFIVEQMAVADIKSMAKKFAHTAFGEAVVLAFPVLGIILLVLKYVATGLWIVGVVEVALHI